MQLDQLGNKVPSQCVSGIIVDGSGETFAPGAHFWDVIPGAKYLITCSATGVAGVVRINNPAVATAANALWIVSKGRTIEVQVPLGVIELLLIVATGATTAYVRRLQ